MQEKIKKAYELIKEGGGIIETRIKEHSEAKKAVVFIGMSRKGKSTLVNMLLEKEMRLIEKSGSLNKAIEGINIGNKAVSMTSIPNVETKNINGENILIWDCPGFGDTRDVANDIANSFYIQKLFNSYNFIKVFIVMSYDDMKSDNLNASINLFKDIFNFFGKGQNFKNYLSSFSLIFNQADNKLLKFNPEKRENLLKEKLESCYEYFSNVSQEECAKDVANLIQSIKDKGRIALFTKPDIDDSNYQSFYANQIFSINKILDLIAADEESKWNKINANKDCLSSEIKLSMITYLNKLKIEIEDNIKSMCSFIVSKLEKDDDNYLNPTFIFNSIDKLKMISELHEQRIDVFEKFLLEFLSFYDDVIKENDVVKENEETMFAKQNIENYLKWLKLCKYLNSDQVEVDFKGCQKIFYKDVIPLLDKQKEQMSPKEIKQINQGEEIISNNGAYIFKYTDDGELIICSAKNQEVLWDANTQGFNKRYGKGQVVAQDDGNFVMKYKLASSCLMFGEIKIGSSIDLPELYLWATDTASSCKAKVFFQYDGSLIVKKTETEDVVWSSNDSEGKLLVKNIAQGQRWLP